MGDFSFDIIKKYQQRQTPAFWYSHNIYHNNNWQKSLLTPLSYLWRFGSHINAKITKTHQHHIPVICVGNIGIGGNGKTPLVQSIAKILQTKNKYPHIITRGYHRYKKYKDFYVDYHEHYVKDTGDEAMLHAQICPTLVFSQHRKYAIDLAKNTGAEIVICDDGFQDYSYHKNCAILAISRYHGLSNHGVIPAGPLRETLDSALQRTDIIAFTGDCEREHGSIDFIKNKAQKLHIPYFTVKTISNAQDIIKKNKRYIIFCGLAQPYRFLSNISAYTPYISKAYIYPDHHFYSTDDIDFLVNIAKEQNAYLITTEKDFVKIPKEYHEDILVIKQTYQLDDRFVQRVLQML